MSYLKPIHLVKTKINPRNLSSGVLPICHQVAAIRKKSMFIYTLTLFFIKIRTTEISNLK